MDKGLDICVVIAAKDAGETVGRAVASALAQPQVREVIVVDDGSADATAAAARGVDDGSGRLRVLVLDANLGPSAARNRALARASAELVCVLDADDHLADGRFARMCAVGGKDWDFLADDLFIASEAAPLAPHARLLGLPDGPPRGLDAAAFIAGNLENPRRARGELGYLKPLMRRDFLLRSGLAYDETLRLGEDYVLYAQALLRGARFLLMPACGYIAVSRPGSLSHRHGAAELAELAAADERLIEEARGSRPDALPALQAHRRGVRHKLDHRLMLDAKTRGDWLAAARHLLHTPATTAYILERTLRARLRVLLPLREKVARSAG